MSRCDVLIHGATAAAMWVAGLDFPEDARSWPGRTKQSLDMNIVDGGSAAQVVATGLSTDGQRRVLLFAAGQNSKPNSYPSAKLRLRTPLAWRTHPTSTALCNLAFVTIRATWSMGCG